MSETIALTKGSYMNVFSNPDLMAARSNTLMNTMNAFNGSSIASGISSTVIELAYNLYNDWDDPTDMGSVRYRGGVAHAYHPVIGKWVPTIKKFEYVADLSAWLTKNATNTSRVRAEYYALWKNMPRGLRCLNPYSYYPVADNKVGAAVSGEGRSIIIKNLNSNMSEADLMLILSVYGPIVDVYRPTHKRKDVIMSDEAKQKCKAAFYIFVEFADATAVDAIVNDTNRVALHFMNYPITISRAGDRSRGPPVVA